MTDTADLLGPFEDDVIASVASRHDIPEADLRDAMAAHQSQARDNPGVEDLVYEWRSQFHEQPLLHRTGEAYYLRLRSHVWDEFADALDIPEATLQAVLDVHEEQTRAVTGAELRGSERMMVLSRE